MKAIKLLGIFSIFFFCLHSFTQDKKQLQKEIKNLISSNSIFTMEDYGGDYNLSYSTSIKFITDDLVEVKVLHINSKAAKSSYATYVDLMNSKTKINQCVEVEEYTFNISDLKTYNGFYADEVYFNFIYPTNSINLDLQSDIKKKHYYYVSSQLKTDYNKIYEYYYDANNQEYYINNKNAKNSLTNISTNSVTIPLKKVTRENNSFIVKLDHLLIQYNFPGKSTAFEYYPNTNIFKYQSIYKNDKLDGYSRYFYKDGSTSLIRYYKNGKELAKIDQRLPNKDLILNNGNGIYMTFYPNGNKKSESEYKLGKRSGKTSWFYENGQLDQTIIYRYDENLIDGLRWEVLSSFDKNGKPREKGTLKNGNGTIILYDSNGKKNGIMNIQNGVLISTTKI